MSAQGEKRAPAFGCGWREGEGDCETRCCMLSCYRTKPCDGEWAGDIYQIITYVSAGIAEHEREP
jgi:hypothetical protein